MQDEGPELCWPNAGCVRGQALGSEEPLKVGRAVGQDLYGLVALALGPGVEPVALDQPG